jgi:hypothetical protein
MSSPSLATAAALVHSSAGTSECGGVFGQGFRTTVRPGHLAVPSENFYRAPSGGAAILSAPLAVYRMGPNIAFLGE